jgi:hypothetical protein
MPELCKISGYRKGKYQKYQKFLCQSYARYQVTAKVNIKNIKNSDARVMQDIRLPQK